MLKAKPEEEDEVEENLGGSTRVNGLPVLRLFRIPIRFRVGLRPAGADSGVDFPMSIRGAGALALRIGRWADVVGLEEEKSLVAGARVRKKLIGLHCVSLLEPSGCLERLGERKMTGSMFSELSLSTSNDVALRLDGEVRLVSAF